MSFQKVVSFLVQILISFSINFSQNTDRFQINSFGFVTVWKLVKSKLCHCKILECVLCQRVKFCFGLSRCGFAVRLVLLKSLVLPRHKFNPHDSSLWTCFHCLKTISDFKMVLYHDEVHQHSMRSHACSFFVTCFCAFVTFRLFASTICTIHQSLTSHCWKHLVPLGRIWVFTILSAISHKYQNQRRIINQQLPTLSNSFVSSTEQHLFSQF